MSGVVPPGSVLTETAAARARIITEERILKYLGRFASCVVRRVWCVVCVCNVCAVQNSKT